MTNPLIHIPTIMYPKDLDRAFKRAARTVYPQEHIEAIAGHFDPWTRTIEIKATLDMAVEKSDSTGLTLVRDEDNEFDETGFCRKWAAELGYTLLGTIHTHPGNDACSAMSTTDHHGGWADKELISGVLHLYRVGDPPAKRQKDRRRWFSRLAWWIPQREILTIYT